jgi:hypothetical protein
VGHVHITYRTNNGLFAPTAIAATVKFAASVNQIKSTDTLPKTAFTNKYVIQAYKNLGEKVPAAEPAAASSSATTTLAK